MQLHWLEQGIKGVRPVESRWVRKLELIRVEICCSMQKLATDPCLLELNGRPSSKMKAVFQIYREKRSEALKDAGMLTCGEFVLKWSYQDQARLGSAMAAQADAILHYPLKKQGSPRSDNSNGDGGISWAYEERRRTWRIMYHGNLVETRVECRWTLGMH